MNTFSAVGFSVFDEDSYDRLARQAGEMGNRYTIYRRGAKLHGCCLKLGGGLEVWAVIYDSERGLFYADCRPAFRPEHLLYLSPWEVTEYDEDGEAMVRGCIDGTSNELIFELQNLTELDVSIFRRPQLCVALAGLSYSATISSRQLSGRLISTGQVNKRRHSCENDYSVRGKIIARKNIVNPITNSHLVWSYIDTGTVRLETLVNSRNLHGEAKVGAVMSAKVWLQGYILDDEAMAAKYEGIDRSFQISDFWSGLRKEN